MNPDDFLRLQSPSLRRLPGNEVHVLCAPLDLPLHHLKRLACTLSPDEQERADRFNFERDRNHYIVRRGLLRTILGSYLDLEPSRVLFSYGPHGKPALKTTFNDLIFQFSLSHSNGIALYAVSWDRRVGIDIEHIRQVPEAGLIIKRFFSTQENFMIDSLPEEQRLEAFFRLWTCKEAYLKATGEGLTSSLEQVEVSLFSSESSRLVSINGDHLDAFHWHLETFRPAPGFLASLAVEGHNWQMVFQQLKESFVNDSIQ